MTVDAGVGMTLLDPGAALVIRPIAPDDGPRLVAFHEALDADSQYRRFFSAHPHLTPTEVEHFTHVDHAAREALVAVDGDRIVAVGRYDQLTAEPETAEVAFVTAVDWRRRGLASTLLHELAQRARSRGVRTLIGETLAANTAMRAVFMRSGYPLTSRYEDGIAETRLDITDL